MTMKKIILTAIIANFLLCINSQTLRSPNKNLILNFELNDSGQPTYKLNYKGNEVIRTSKLGLELKKNSSLLENFEITDSVFSKFDETWKPVWGEVKEISNEHNELLVVLKQKKTERIMKIRFRLFNDGLGFRYEFEKQANSTLTD